MDGQLAFFQEFLKHPKQLGSIIPSSRFLERRIVKAAGVSTARTVVELGPGNGGTTKAILRSMPRTGRLLSIELNPQLHALTSRIKDERLITHLGTALQLPELLEHYKLEPPEAVISGIPFSTTGDDIGAAIIDAVASVLVPGGRFVAYQVSNRVYSLGKRFPGRADVEFELLNIPPVRVFRWRKHP